MHQAFFRHKLSFTTVIPLHRFSTKYYAWTVVYVKDPREALETILENF